MKKSHPLKVLRATYELSREDVAEMCGKSRTSGPMISKWENGKSSPTMEDMFLLSKALGKTEIDNLCRDWLEWRSNV